MAAGNGQISTEEQVSWLSKKWAKRAALPIMCLPCWTTLPPVCTQVSAQCSHCSSQQGKKLCRSRACQQSKYWELIYEDSMDLIAKLPCVAAKICRNLCWESSSIGATDSALTLPHSFTNRLGYLDAQSTERMRSCPSTVTTRVAMKCLYQPLGGQCLSRIPPVPRSSHGRSGRAPAWPADQEVLVWLMQPEEEVGKAVSHEKLRGYIWKYSAQSGSSQAVSRAVLRKTDPRCMWQGEFVLKHLPHDAVCKLVAQLYRVVSSVLSEQSKAKSPWPSADARSGALLRHCGTMETNYGTVLVGASRALSALARLVWGAVLGFPLERPKSASTGGQMKFVDSKDEPGDPGK